MTAEIHEGRLMNLLKLLVALQEQKAEALHVTLSAQPSLLLGGEWVPLKTDPLTPVETKMLLYSVLNDEQKERFERSGQILLSFGVTGHSRFLALGYLQRGACAATFWPVPFQLPTPPIWVSKTVALLTPGPGLLVAAGPKRIPVSTVLAWWIDQINRTRSSVIASVEEPITFLHPHKQSLVEQIEVPSDVQADQLAALVTNTVADVLSLDLANGLPMATVGLAGGRLVVCSLRAPDLEAATGALRATLPPALQPQLRALVFEDGTGEPTVLQGPSLLNA